MLGGNFGWRSTKAFCSPLTEFEGDIHNSKACQLFQCCCHTLQLCGGHECAWGREERYPKQAQAPLCRLLCAAAQRRRYQQHVWSPYAGTQHLPSCGNCDTPVVGTPRVLSQLTELQACRENHAPSCVREFLAQDRVHVYYQQLMALYAKNIGPKLLPKRLGQRNGLYVVFRLVPIRTVLYTGHAHAVMQLYLAACRAASTLPPSARR